MAHGSAALALALLSSSPLHAQTFRGALSGTVSDSSGAVLPNATVEITNPETNNKLTIHSNGAGDFSFPELPVGRYQLSVSEAGFDTRKIENIAVDASKVVNLRVQLTVGQEQTIIEVAASGVQLDTTTSSMVAIVDQKSVQEIPLNGRNFMQMVQLAPGVNPLNRSTNGSRVNSINFQIDGADNNDPWSNQVASNQGGVAGIAGGLVPIEAIEQFSLQDNAESDQGRDAGANSNMVLRSGTNHIHGDLFYFDRNEFFASLSPVAIPGSRKPEIRNHQGGFTLGGPLWKDHTFLFLAGEVQIAQANNSIGDTVLSDAWIGAATRYLGLYGLAPNQVSLNLYGLLFPAASRGGGATSSNYLSTGLNSYNSYNGVIKLDHHFNSREQLSIRYLGTTGTQTADVGSHYADYFERAPMHIHNFSIVQNSTLTSKLVNQLTFGTGYFLQTFNDANQNFNTQGTGLNLGLAGFLAEGATKLTVTGFDYTGATAPLGRTDVTGHVTDTLNWTLGKHNLKLGGEYRHANVNVGYYTNGRGAFAFDGSRGPWSSSGGSVTALGTANCASLGFSNSNTNGATCSALRNVADFLNGTPTNSSGALILRNNPQRVYLINSVDGWAQDDFQVSQRLTVNYGIRYSYPGVVADDRNSLYNFDQTLAASGAASPYTPIPLFNRDLSDAAPRVGFAFTPSRNNPSLVVRGAYGWYYDQPTVGQFVYNNIGNTGATGIYSNPAGSSPVFQPVATGVQFTPNAAIFPTTLSSSTSLGAFSIAKNFRTAYLQNFNLNIEQQLTKNTLFSVAYVGSLGRRLGLVRDINQPINGIRPYSHFYPTLQAVNQVESGGSSNYNSMQMSLRQAAWHGLSATVYYTWGRSMDYVSSVTTPENSYNLRADYGPSTFDSRNIFDGFASYSLPQFGHALPLLTKGWQLNALYNFAGGTPINILAGTNISLTSENKDRATRVPTVALKAGKPITTLTTARTFQYLTKGSYLAPTSGFGVYGTERRDSVYGPGFGDVDFSIFKHTPINERVNTELRAELFNIANQANFANPSGTVSSSSFGALTQTRNGSIAPGLGQGEPFNVQFAFKVTF